MLSCEDASPTTCHGLCTHKFALSWCKRYPNSTKAIGHSLPYIACLILRCIVCSFQLTIEQSGALYVPVREFPCMESGSAWRVDLSLAPRANILAPQSDGIRRVHDTSLRNGPRRSKHKRTLISTRNMYGRRTGREPASAYDHAMH
jgi:hypothetical protein